MLPGVNGHHPLLQHLIYLVRVVPGLIRYGNLIRLQSGHNGFCEHGPVVGGIGLLGDHHNRPRFVPLPDGLGRVEACSPISQNQVKFLRVVGKCILFLLHRDKILLSHPADRADLQGCVEYLPADQALHQAAPSAGFLLLSRKHCLLFQHIAAKPEAIFIGADQIRLAGLKPHPKSGRDLHLQLLKPLGQVGHALPAPSVAAEHTAPAAGPDPRRHVKSQLPDGPQGVPQDGRRSQEDPVRPLHLLADLRAVRLHHIVNAHVNLPAVPHALGDPLRQHPRIPVGAHIRDEHGFLPVGIRGLGPLPVKGHHPADPIPHKHRPVARADHGDIQILHPIQGLFHEGLKGPDNAVIIILQGLLIVLLVHNGRGNHLGQAVVSAEGITGHQYLFFPDKCVHGIRPMQVRHNQKLQGPVPDPHLLVVLHRQAHKVLIHNLLQEADRAGGSHDLHLGAVLQKPLHASRVIRLRVAHHQIVDGRHIDNSPKLLQILLKKSRFCRLKENRLPCGFHHIGIVGCAELRVHDNIKHPELLIHNSRPIKVFTKLYRFHFGPPILFV